MDFTHTHVHTQYSVLDGINRIDKLCARIKELGMSACTITDHGNLHGAIEFYKEAKKQGIKPLIGVEAYITENKDDQDEGRFRDNNHLIMIAMNQKGLSNLFWLISNANLHNFYYNPRIWEGHLADHNEGILVTTACLGGYVAEGLKVDDDKGTGRLRYLHEVFGDRLYAEIQDNRSFEQSVYNTWLIESARREGIPVTIAADAHYLCKDDFDTHRLCMAQGLKKTYEEYCASEEMNHYHECYIKTPDEMLDAAKKYGCEEAFHNTVGLAQRVSLDIELGKYKMPAFKVEDTEDYQEFLEYKKNHEVSRSR